MPCPPENLRATSALPWFAPVHHHPNGRVCAVATPVPFKTLNRSAHGGGIALGVCVDEAAQDPGHQHAQGSSSREGLQLLG